MCDLPAQLCTVRVQMYPNRESNNSGKTTDRVFLRFGIGVQLALLRHHELAQALLRLD
jgi:hypothetical protein